MTKENGSHQLSLDYALQKLRQTTNETQPEHTVSIEPMLSMMGDFGTRIQDVFACMAIAEEEISAAQARQPDRADDIWNSFKYLQPSELLQPRTPQLYRAHAKEIVFRIAHGQTKRTQLEAATAAELCCVFSAVSLASPLQSDAVAAYQKLFKQVFPNVTIYEGMAIQESYPGRTDEIISSLRRRCSVPR